MEKKPFLFVFNRKETYQIDQAFIFSVVFSLNRESRHCDYTDSWLKVGPRLSKGKEQAFESILSFSSMLRRASFRKRGTHDVVCSNLSVYTMQQKGRLQGQRAFVHPPVCMVDC